MNICRTLAVSGIVSVLSGVAYADELFTPPLPALFGDFLQCTLVNVGRTSQNVTVQAIDSTGAIVSNNAFVLGPGAGGGASIPSTAAGFYCKFIVEKAKTIRAAIAVLEPGVGLRSALSAQER